jgi:dUTP pyrophosphatase
MVFNVKKLVPHAVLPIRGSAYAAGYDLHAIEDYVVQPGRRTVVSTGISVQFPPGTYGRIAPRSGLAVKHGIDVLAGVIDPDYTGELKVVLFNSDARQSFVIRQGYRIAQIILENFEAHEVSEIETIDLTNEDEPCPAPIRGDHGFGSTGLGGYTACGV